MISKNWPQIRRVDDEAERVTKFVYTKQDAVAESVLYRYPTYRERTVICCSTQSGCPMGCRFCGAGDQFVRSLTVDEIVAQPVHCLKQIDCRPDEIGRLQIMFMSMGEPLLNLKSLIPALHELHARYPNAALLISTSAPRIADDAWRELIEVSKAIPTIGLQFSVHETSNRARDELIPFRAKMTLIEIAARGGQWGREVGRKPFFNYCAHDGNTNDEDARRLEVYFEPNEFCATVSVVCERSDGLPATNDHQRSLAVGFGEKLLARGFDVRVFDPAGQDTIGGGCGQLHFVQRWFHDNPDLAKPSVGFGLPVVHAPKPERHAPTPAAA